MSSLQSHKYNRDLFHRFLVKQMQMQHDSANSYVSYVNNVSKLLEVISKPLFRTIHEPSHAT